MPIIIISVMRASTRTTAKHLHAVPAQRTRIVVRKSNVNGCNCRLAAEGHVLMFRKPSVLLIARSQSSHAIQSERIDLRTGWWKMASSNAVT
jgi:hypothetical protein